MALTLGLARGGDHELFRLQAGRGLDERIVREVFGKEVVNGEVPDWQDQPVPRYSTDMAAAWDLVEYFAEHAGYANPGKGEYWFDGPLFKGKDKYLTKEGYGLGSTCWYVSASLGGMRVSVCADTPALAVARAALWMLYVLEEHLKHMRENPRNYFTPSWGKCGGKVRGFDRDSKEVWYTIGEVQNEP